MAQSATPYTHPRKIKIYSVPTKRIYPPGLHSIGYLGLRGLTPRNFVKNTIFCFPQKNRVITCQTFMTLAQLETPKKIGAKAAGLDIKNHDFSLADKKLLSRHQILLNNTGCCLYHDCKF